MREIPVETFLVDFFFFLNNRFEVGDSDDPGFTRWKMREMSRKIRIWGEMIALNPVAWKDNTESDLLLITIGEFSNFALRFWLFLEQKKIAVQKNTSRAHVEAKGGMIACFDK